MVRRIYIANDLGCAFMLDEVSGVLLYQPLVYANKATHEVMFELEEFDEVDEDLLEGEGVVFRGLYYNWDEVYKIIKKELKA